MLSSYEIEMDLTLCGNFSPIIAARSWPRVQPPSPIALNDAFLTATAALEIQVYVHPCVHVHHTCYSCIKALIGLNGLHGRHGLQNLLKSQPPGLQYLLYRVLTFLILQGYTHPREYIVTEWPVVRLIINIYHWWKSFKDCKDYLHNFWKNGFKFV